MPGRSGETTFGRECIPHFHPPFRAPLQKADDTKSMAEEKKKNRRGRWLQRLVAKGGAR